jgi:hypothetical protein
MMTDIIINEEALVSKTKELVQSTACPRDKAEFNLMIVEWAKFVSGEDLSYLLKKGND